MTSPFDEIIDRRGTHSNKWDDMEAVHGVSAQDGLAMWVADTDFRPPQVVQDVIEEMARVGVYGYGGRRDYLHEAVQWWMAERHGWQIETDWVTSTAGLVNAVGLCIDTWTRPGDGVVIFTPVYHAFARVIKAAGRSIVECPLVQTGDRYEMNFDAYDVQMTGKERMVILCSPHNPGGRVWSREELAELAAFAERHDLLLVSDEIHHDIVMPGHKHIAMPLAAPGIVDRLVMLTAGSKTFNLAGGHEGQVTIPNPDLRKAFRSRISALGVSPNAFGPRMTAAAYSPEGAAWVDTLVAYLDGNRKLFDAAIHEIPGLRSMPLEATFLAWVDFSGTGMPREDFTRRVQQEARIAANLGTTFGTGGETFLRFNIGMPRSRIAEAAERLQSAFADLQ